MRKQMLARKASVRDATVSAASCTGAHRLTGKLRRHPRAASAARPAAGPLPHLAGPCAAAGC